MDCSSKKNQYYTEEEAMEALVRSHIRYNNPANSYYLCSECAVSSHITRTNAPNAQTHRNNRTHKKRAAVTRLVTTFEEKIDRLG